MIIGIIISASFFFIFVAYLGLYKLQRMPAIPVLKYHRVNNVTQDAITITPQLFEKQIIKLKEMSYRSIFLSEFEDYIYKQKKIPDKVVALTFDDGHFDNYEIAFPILKKHDFKATIFLTTSLIKEFDQNNKQTMTTTPFKDALLRYDYSGFLNWDQIKEMHDSGLIDFQPHTHFHRFRFKNKKIIGKVLDPNDLDFKTASCFDWNIKEGDPIYKSGASLLTMAYSPKSGSTENTPKYHDRIYDEIEESRKIIAEHLSKSCDHIAWPWGLFNRSSCRLARILGFTLMLTTFYGSNHFFTSKEKIKRFTPTVKIDQFPEEIMRNSYLLSSLCIDNKLYNIFSKRFIRRKLKESNK